MTDEHLLLFGVGISFIVLAGVYVYFRDLGEPSPRKQAPQPVVRSQSVLRDATSKT